MVSLAMHNAMAIANAVERRSRNFFSCLGSVLRTPASRNYNATLFLAVSINKGEARLQFEVVQRNCGADVPM